MNKKVFLIMIFLFGFLSLSYSIPASGLLKEDAIEKIKVSENQIPRGFMYGKIPTFAKDVIKANPWVMDRGAINRLAKNIYPDGNAQAIKALYVSILTRKEAPYGDDIVCYILLFKDASSAKSEIAKLKDFSKYNKDRQLLIIKDNLAVYLHVDDVADYVHIQKIAEDMQSKMDTM